MFGEKSQLNLSFKQVARASKYSPQFESVYDMKYCFDLKCWYLFLNNTCCQIEKLQKALFASAVPVKTFHQL